MDYESIMLNVFIRTDRKKKQHLSSSVHEISFN